MKGISFPQSNLNLAENQAEYETLPVYVDESDPMVPVTACFELTQPEIDELVRTRKLWYTQCTFGKSFHPISMSTQNPFG